MSDHIYDQIIIGAGFAGLCMAIKLKQANMHDFIIFERNEKLGGTWYDNAYPGAACDVESHLYSYSFERKTDWSRQFSPQQEILNYMEQCAVKYDVKKRIYFNCRVISAVFIESASVWHLTIDNGITYKTRHLITCTGGLSQPMLPDIKGIDSFKGEKFHSARWNKDFDITGKTVAVIGTGASAIQIVPAIADKVKELLLFQRTPPWIIEKPDKTISGFRKAIYKYLPFMQWLYRFRLYWVHELMAIAFTKNPDLLKLFSKIALRYLKKSVPDEGLRKKLTPTYVMGCKRILLSNDYYPALQRRNVDVITTGIEEINERGVETENGKQYNLDAIVFATGFKAADDIVPFNIKGRAGVNLKEAWAESAEAYLGTTVTGFPNFYLVVGPNTGLGHSSMILMIEAQVHYIMECLKHLIDSNHRVAEVKKQVQENYNADIQLKLSKTVWQSGGCHSWYQNKNGKNVALWPGFTFTFMNRTRKFVESEYELFK